MKEVYVLLRVYSKKNITNIGVYSSLSNAEKARSNQIEIDNESDCDDDPTSSIDDFIIERHTINPDTPVINGCSCSDCATFYQKNSFYT